MEIQSFEDIVSDFEFLENWEQRFQHIIELGQRLDGQSASIRSSENKVDGCASQVWIATEVHPGPDPVIFFEGSSDSALVQGLVAILLALYSGKTASEIIAIDPRRSLARLGLDDHLSKQRSSGSAAMVSRLRQDATRS